MSGPVRFSEQVIEAMGRWGVDYPTARGRLLTYSAAAAGGVEAVKQFNNPGPGSCGECGAAKSAHSARDLEFCAREAARPPETVESNEESR